MLAEMAPSVAGWPALKPKSADAARAIAITPTPTVAPLTMCWPTSSRFRSGDRKLRMVRRQARAALLSASTARAAVGFRPEPSASAKATSSRIIFGVQ